MNAIEDTLVSYVRQMLMTVKETLVKTEQLVKTSSLISIAIARQALRESSARLILMTVQVHLVITVAHVLTE